mgnify:CR=1 FL=1
MPDSYLVIQPQRPTPEEYARGARLIPSMLDEGVCVWRVPVAVPATVPATSPDNLREFSRGK